MILQFLILFIQNCAMNLILVGILDNNIIGEGNRFRKLLNKVIVVDTVSKDLQQV